MHAQIYYESWKNTMAKCTYFSKKNEAIDHPDERDMESGLVLHSISQYNWHPWLTSRDFAFL